MPLHDLRCPKCGVHYENVVVQLDSMMVCENCEPPVELEIFWRKAPAAFVQQDICYDSPIDGRPITNKQARIEDLRRNDCVEYDPGVRQDAARRRKQEEADLDKSVDATVDEFVATAPVRKLEKLEQEIRAGASVDVVRSTPDVAALT